MAFEHYIYSGTEKLRRGYTTGTTATLAAKGATELLFSGIVPVTVSTMTAAGIEVTIEPVASELAPDGSYATCSVQKDAGDDYDATHEIVICARVSRSDELGIHIDGGFGVGRVTQEGLDQPVGNAAINSHPRQTIAEEVSSICDEHGYEGGIDVLIEVPEGEKVGAKTFNPQIGIVGGISIIGTSGIVEPRSLEKLMDTLKVEVHARRAAGSDRLIIALGNYGENFLKTFGLPPEIPIVKCANFIGRTIDQCVLEGYREVLVVGHIGKLSKVAGNIMDTYSKVADCRREIFAAHAAACGASQETVLKIFDAATTDACLDILEEVNLDKPVMKRIIDAIQTNIERRSQGVFKIGAVVFSNAHGTLGMSNTGEEIVNSWRAG